jgi:cellulose synthase/poly-beta-1,6-N-acetylglucosamine synthase-like glycosyltransferase
VVTPTEGRANLIEQLLESLSRARDAYRGDVEFLLVDSSGAEDAARIQTFCIAHGARYLEGENSVRSKRNKGIEEARHPITLFIDSDCRAHRDLFTEHAMVHIQSPTDVVGCVGLISMQHDDTFYWRVMQRTPFLLAFQIAEAGDYALWGPTANISYRTEVLRSVGGFDQQLPFKLGGDDIDIGLRITAAGYRLRTNRQAVVDHAQETWTLIGVLKRAFRWGRVQSHLLRKHSHRAVLATPQAPTVLLVLGIASGFNAAVRFSAVALLLPLIWLICYLAVELCLLALRGRSIGSTFRDWCASQMTLVFEFGQVLEGLKYGDLRMLYLAFSNNDPDVAPLKEEVRVGQRRVIRLWSIILAMVICLLFV